MGVDAQTLVALATVLMILAIVSTVLRFWARSITAVSLATDDYLILPALATVIAEAIWCYWVAVAYGGAGRPDDFVLGPDHQPVFTTSLSNYGKFEFAMQLLPTIALGFTKVSVLFFYRRIFVGVTFNKVTVVLMAVSVIWAVSFVLATVFQCVPVYQLWTSFRFAWTHCIDTVSMYYAVSVTGFVTDIIILTVPLPMVFRLQMRPKQKCAVAGIFLLGSFVCGAAIARFAIFIQIGQGVPYHLTDENYFSLPTHVCTLFESALGVVSANLPTMRSVFMRKGGEGSFFSLRRLVPGLSYRHGTGRTTGGNGGRSAETGRKGSKEGEDSREVLPLATMERDML
ncbi:hypothetical protein MMC10_003523 [Thelotrema lepadinum]|nr:hypothetical protein [Thelotrema lepadinum]